MKLTAFVCAILPALLATPCRAEIDFHGVLAPGDHTVIVDTAFAHISPPAVDTFLTPGWQADSTVALDSFDFPGIANWPVFLELAVRVDGVPGRQMFIEPVRELWYIFQGILPIEPSVMFWTSTGIASPPAGTPRANLTVEPSVLRSRVRLGIAGNGTAGTLSVFDAAGNRVRTFNTERDGWSAYWAGDDDHGNLLPAGTYFCRLSAGTGGAVAKVLVAR